MIHLKKQAQMCAEGCEEDDITHFFHIKCKHKLCTFIELTKLCTKSLIIWNVYEASFIYRLIKTSNEVTQGYFELNGVKQG